MGMDAELVKQNKNLKEDMEALRARNRQLSAELGRLKADEEPAQTALCKEVETLKAENLRLAGENARLREALRGWEAGESWEIGWLLSIIDAMDAAALNADKKREPRMSMRRGQA